MGNFVPSGPSGGLCGSRGRSTRLAGHGHSRPSCRPTIRGLVQRTCTSQRCLCAVAGSDQEPAQAAEIGRVGKKNGRMLATGGMAATWSAGGWCRSVLGGPRRRGAMTGFDLIERDFHLDECLRHRTRGPCLSSVIRGSDADARRRPAAACTRCLVGRGSRSIDGQEDCTACQRGQGHECRQFAADERQSAGHFASLRRGLTSNGRTGGAAKNRRHANAACVLLRSEPGQPGVPWPV